MIKIKNRKTYDFRFGGTFLTSFSTGFSAGFSAGFSTAFLFLVDFLKMILAQKNARKSAKNGHIVAKIGKNWLELDSYGHNLALEWPNIGPKFAKIFQKLFFDLLWCISSLLLFLFWVLVFDSSRASDHIFSNFSLNFFLWLNFELQGKKALFLITW